MFAQLVTLINVHLHLKLISLKIVDKANYAEFQKARKREENTLTNLSEFSALMPRAFLVLTRSTRTKKFGGCIYFIMVVNFYNACRFEIYILNAFTEKPSSKLMIRNVVYNPITTPSHATSHDR